jgi:hypothetical protein
MLTAIAATIVLAGQTRTVNAPKISFQSPIIGGQKHIIFGAKPESAVLLNGYLEREVGAKHIATPGNTGSDYVDSWIPGGTHEENLGFFDCSSKEDSLFSKPCILITSAGKWNQTLGRKPNQVKIETTAKQQWWVTADGTILRHYSALQTPDGIQFGDCTYGKDSVERRYTDVNGKTSFGEVFPSCGMDALHAQFKPMVVDGKVVMRDKEFSVLNPLTGGIDKYSAHVSGTFKGEFLNATFKGKLFDIQGPKFFEKVFIDDTGDLVKVALDDDRAFVINVVPSSHLDEYGRPIRKGGG